MSAGFSSEASLSGLEMAIISLSSHSPSSMLDFVLISSSYKDTSHVGLEPILMNSFHLSYCYKALSSKLVTS